jgi:hypothetical protein
MVRRCDECELCCTLLPVKAINKPGGQRCKYLAPVISLQRGCTLYPRHPRSCQVWSCEWINDADVEGIGRPDKVGYVIDPVLDLVTMTDNNTGKVQRVPVIQVWVDPSRRGAERDPALRAFIARRAAEGYPTLIRPTAATAYAVFAPPLMKEWKEYPEAWCDPDHESTQLEVAMVLAGVTPNDRKRVP